MIDAGQQAAIDRWRRDLHQGDVVTIPVFAVLGSPASTPEADTAAGRGESGDRVIAVQRDAATTRWAILSQSCDIHKAIDSEPYLQVAPLVSATEDEWTQADGGILTLGQFAYPRGTAGINYPVLDITIVQTLEKAALGDPRLAPEQLNVSARTRTKLAAWIARRFARHAFPDALEEAALGRLRETIAKRRSDLSQPAGVLIAALEGVWVRYDAETVQIRFIVGRDRMEPARTLNSADPVSVVEQGANTVMDAVIRRVRSQGDNYRCAWTVSSSDRVPAEDILHFYHALDLGVG